MENRDDEFYGPKDLLSPATREEFLYIKSDMPSQTGLIEDSPTVAIGLQHDRNHISDWLKANLPPLMFALLILSIVSLTFTGPWNRGPEYSGILILGNSNVDSIKQNSVTSPDFDVPNKAKTYSSDLNKENIYPKYSGAYKKPPLYSIEIKDRNNYSKKDSLSMCNIELNKEILVYQKKLRRLEREYQQAKMDLDRIKHEYGRHYENANESKLYSYLLVDTIRKLNSCVYDDQKQVDNQSDLSFYDKNGMHWNLVIKPDNKFKKPSNCSTQKDLSCKSSAERNYLEARKALEIAKSEQAKYSYLEARKALEKANREQANYSKLLNVNNKLACLLADLSDTVRILNACVSGYQKTNVELKNKIIIHLSTHGTITNEYCKISFSPEGVKQLESNTSPDCAPLDPNYNLGALLFRIGESDAWKPYTGDNMPIKIDKPGVLEFTINFKSTKNIKGNYQVLAYEKPHEEEGK